MSHYTYSKVRYCLCCRVCQLVPFQAFPALIQSQPLSQINCPLQYQVSQHETEESGIQLFPEHLDHSVSGHKWLAISDSSRFCHTMGRMEAAEYLHVVKRLRGTDLFTLHCGPKSQIRLRRGKGVGGWCTLYKIYKRSRTFFSPFLAGKVSLENYLSKKSDGHSAACCNKLCFTDCSFKCTQSFTCRNAPSLTKQYWK